MKGESPILPGNFVLKLRDPGQNKPSKFREALTAIAIMCAASVTAAALIVAAAVALCVVVAGDHPASREVQGFHGKELLPSLGAIRI